MLDLGCGTGIVARVLRERLGGAAKIVGVDVSPEMIEEARSVAPEIDFLVGDACALPFEDASFELVLCREMLEVVPERLAALREVRRVLSPGGRLLVSTSSSFSLDGPTLEGALTEAGFTRIRIETVPIDEGSGAHTVVNVATAMAPPRV
jgi:ubiquinone/menaquinone biosynthesis C-methylase UbiE